MKKFSFAYVKQNPIMFGVIFIVFGLLLWLLMNRSAGGGGATVYGSTGPSDAQIAAGANIQMAQVAAARDTTLAQYQFAALQATSEHSLQIANLELGYGLAELAVNERLENHSLEASLAALKIQGDNNLDLAVANNNFQIGYARVAADSAVTQLAIGAALQRDLSAQQLEAFKVGAETNKFISMLSVIPTLKKSNRDEALAGLGGYTIPANGGGGGGFLSGLASVLSPAYNLVK